MTAVVGARRAVVLCASLSLAVALLFSPVVAEAIPPQIGGISGTVRDSTGVTGLSGIQVQLFDSTSTVVATATAYTNGLGNYAFSGLQAPRSYYMRLADNNPPYYWASEFYKHHFGAFTDLGDPIAVSVGSTQSINPTMTIAAVVDGVVHRKGHPESLVASATLHLLWMGEDPQRSSQDSWPTHADGTFDAMRGLFPGPYMFWVYFRPDVITDPAYAPTAWNSDTRVLGAGTTTTVDIEVPLKPVTVSNATPGWHKAPFLFQLTVVDGDLPPFTPHVYFGPHGIDADLSALNFASDTSQTVWFWSKDASGNVEATKSVDVHVDATPPECTTTAGFVEGGVNKSVGFYVEDELSGPGHTDYWIDGGPKRIYSGPVSLPAGAHTIQYQGFDLAGNADDTETVHVVNPPAVVLGKPSAPSSVKKNRSFSIWGSISPKQAKGDRSTKLLCYRAVGGVWKLAKTVWTTSRLVSGKSRYSANLKLPSKGSWKIVAYSPGTYCERWPGWSVAKFMRVK